MDIYEALFTRRSLRKYLDEAISDEDERLILKAAMLAPSACNEQPWNFVCIRDAAMRETVSKASPHARMAAKAPLVIIVCADMALEKAKDMWVQDCSAAVQNMLLAARGKNIGSVWCGIYPEQDRMDALKEALGLPDGVVPFALVCFGYAEKGFTEADRFLPEKIHREKWNSKA